METASTPLSQTKAKLKPHIGGDSLLGEFRKDSGSSKAPKGL